MVAELLRLRLHSLANDVRSGPRRWFGAVVAALFVLVASLAVAFLVSGLRSSGVDEVRAVVVGGGSLLLLGFAVVPLANVRAPWSDPRRLATLGVPERSAAVGLALGGAVGLPALALVVLSTGYVRAWGEGWGVALVAVGAAVLAGATALLLALVASGLDAVVLTTRAARRFLLVGVVLLAVLLVPLVVEVVRAVLPGGVGSAGVSDALAWTPLGAALSLPGHVAEGDTGRVVADLVVALATVGLLWAAWRLLVARAFLDGPEPDVSEEPSGLGWFEVVRATPTGAVAARSLTYWLRDARYRVSLAIIPFLPLLVLPLGVAGVSWHWLALVPVPVMCLLLGFLPHNDVAYDSTALWLHVVADTSGLADRVGRLVPAVLLGAPIVGLGSVVATWVHGDWSVLGSELGVSASLLLCGLGLSSVVSAALPYAAVRPHDDPFQQPQSTGSSAGWAQTTMIGGALLLTLPTAWPAVRQVLGLQADGATVALWTGLGTGAAVLVLGVLVGARVFSRRAPELLAFTMRT